MQDNIVLPFTGKRDPRRLSTFGRCSMGPPTQSNLKTAISGTGQTANVCYFYPFRIRSTQIYAGMGWLNGATITGGEQANAGIYNINGTAITGAAIGLTNVVGANAFQETAFSSPVTLAAGLYALAFVSVDNTTTFVRSTTVAGVLRLFGARQLAAFTDLTASAAAWTGLTVNYTPYVYAYKTNTIAATPPPNNNIEYLSIGPLAENLAEWQAIGVGGPTSTVWPAANLALYYPVYLEAPLTLNQFAWYNGSAVAGTVDMGIFDELGNKIASTGATAQAGTTAPQAVTITGGLTVGPGQYWLGMLCSSGTAQINRLTMSGSLTGICEAMGVVQQAVGAATLPATFTPAAPGQDYVPCMAMTTLTLVL